MNPTGEWPPDRLRRQLLERLQVLQQEGVWGLSLGRPVESRNLRDEGGRVGPSGDSETNFAAAAEVAAGAMPPTLQADLFGGVVDQKGPAEAGETLETIEAEALDCVACRLHEGRTKVVFGVGNRQARLLFIGEGPGRDEDLQGEPFVGRAGRLLTRIIEAMGYARGDVYIANAVKCRPPQNRNPQADELAACKPFLLRQIGAIRPRIIVLLGRVAVQAVLGSTAPLSRLRGRFQQWQGIQVMCTYHPAYLLRNPNAKKDVWEDMKMVREALAADEGR
ncbi:MAG: uracil-DNA glycosylase family protein [Acidobacteriota bacterium]